MVLRQDKNKIHKTAKFKNTGFTLIEALVVLFVFSIITLAFYSVFTLGSRYIVESKNHLGAVALANEKMEIIRNLKYDDIGIVGGIPDGNIPAEEDVMENKHAYHVKTFVQYVDDPFDGVGPTDFDYKRVKVTVSWKGVKKTDSSLFLVARFVPPGIEQALAGGTLSINVIGSDGIGVPQAAVHVVNDDVSPSIDLTAMTDNTGNLMLPGAKQSIQGYYMTVSKDGYETVEMIDPNSVTYSVTDTPASVVEGMLSVKSIVQDKLANLKFLTVDYAGVPIPSATFHLEGGRILGYDMLYSPALPTYNLVANKTTDGDGQVLLEDVSPGQFFISDIGQVADHTLIGLDNFSSVDSSGLRYAALVAPDESKEIKIKFAKNNDNSLLVRVVNDADNLPISNAEVKLSNVSGYSETLNTLADGVVFFPNSSTQLELGTYNLEVTADGHNAYAGTIEIDKLINQQVRLTAI